MTILFSLMVVIFQSESNNTMGKPPSTELGFSKDNPASIGDIVLFKDDHIKGSKLSIVCIESYHGIEAYNRMLVNSKDAFIIQPNGNYEYLIIKFNISFVNSNEKNRYFYASNGHFYLYQSSNSSGKPEWLQASSMKPLIESKLLKNDSIEGWVTFKINKNTDYVYISYVNNNIWFKINIK
ncbi:DUF4352 domain-containing protein [Methanocella arvoryzae]|uniref:DUF4352 domain-containing protein n=1 Tax=Methanocella arvoryzae TaxID=1175445 RepID=UPI0013051887|nr:DUF4352 domain-containing protein [Methanocella arvoryzae]